MTLDVSPVLQHLIALESRYVYLHMLTPHMYINLSTYVTQTPPYAYSHMITTHMYTDICHRHLKTHNQNSIHQVRKKGVSV